MATRSESKTIGQAITELVAEYGQDPTGIHILHDALIESLNLKGALLYRDSEHKTRLYHQCPQYKRLQADHDAAIQRIRDHLAQ
jgi:hypothetical protein